MYLNICFNNGIKKEIGKRKDFRQETIFTIDPKNARDLDDALHIKRIEDCDGEGTSGWEIGVHIADVTHFLRAHTELDNWAEHRANSVYLVHTVSHSTLKQMVK